MNTEINLEEWLLLKEALNQWDNPYWSGWNIVHLFNWREDSIVQELEDNYNLNK